MAHTLHQRVILDMDSSESPVHGQQEGAAYNGHFECVCYHPLFLFNQFGDCEGAKLRSGNVHSADDWQEVSIRWWRVILQQQSGCCFALMPPSPSRRYTSIWRPDRSTTPSGCQQRSATEEIAHLLTTRPTEGAFPKPIVSYHDFTYQAQSWNVSRRVVAKVEWHQGGTVSQSGLHSYQPQLIQL